nr:hypothetical protein [Schaalia sp. lx-260]
MSRSLAPCFAPLGQGVPVSEATVEALVFSDDADVREAVITGVGIRASKDTPRITWHQAATTFGVLESVKEHDFSIIVLDAEAHKHGGMGIAKELHNTLADVPPVLFITARQQDSWLASWAGAAAIVCAPIDPLELQEKVADLLRKN